MQPMSQVRDLDNALHPIADKQLHRLLAEPDLNGAMGQRPQPEVPFRIPLNPHGTGGLDLMPLARITGRVAEAAVLQRPFKAVSSDINRQDATLSRVFQAP